MDSFGVDLVSRVVRTRHAKNDGSVEKSNSAGIRKAQFGCRFRQPLACADSWSLTAQVAWSHASRRSLDVDAVVPLDDEILLASSRVAREYGLADDWLNSKALAFAPSYALAECTPVLNKERLVVLALPARALFAMKLLAARSRDIEDLTILWPDSGFTSAQMAVDYFYEHYPHENPDPHLAEFIQVNVIDHGRS